MKKAMMCMILLRAIRMQSAEIHHFNLPFSDMFLRLVLVIESQSTKFKLHKLHAQGNHSEMQPQELPDMFISN